jgi:hypothetical protein
MVSSVGSSTYYSYLNQLQGTQAASSTSSASGLSSATAAATTAASTTSQSLVSSLLSGGAYSSSVLSLLQENSSGGFNPITSLLGGASENTGLTTLYSNLYDSASAAVLTQAQETNTPTAAVTTTTNAETLINAQTQASIAYNQTLQQNTAAALVANANAVNRIIS